MIAYKCMLFFILFCSECQLWSFFLALESCSVVSLACSASLVIEICSRTLFVLSQPIPGAVTEEKQGYVRKASGQAVYQYQCYWWCMSQSKIQLTNPELGQLVRTEKQNKKYIYINNNFFKRQTFMLSRSFNSMYIWRLAFGVGRYSCRALIEFFDFFYVKS